MKPSTLLSCREDGRPLAVSIQITLHGAQNNSGDQGFALGVPVFHEKGKENKNQKRGRERLGVGATVPVPFLHTKCRIHPCSSQNLTAELTTPFLLHEYREWGSWERSQGKPFMIRLALNRIQQIWTIKMFCFSLRLNLYNHPKLHFHSFSTL